MTIETKSPLTQMFEDSVSAACKKLESYGKIHSHLSKKSKSKKNIKTDSVWEAFISIAIGLFETIEQYRQDSITILTYAKETLRYWEELGKFRDNFDHRAGLIASIPCTIVAGTFLDIPEKYPLQGFEVGTQKTCISGINRDGSPIYKNQDVAIGKSIFLDGGNQLMLPIYTVEVKEVYIDKTMLHSPTSCALTSKAVFKPVKSEVFTPIVQGSGSSSNFLTVRAVSLETQRTYMRRFFDSSVLVDMRHNIVSHINAMPDNVFDNWKLPSYPEYLRNKILLEVEDCPEVFENGLVESLDSKRAIA